MQVNKCNECGAAIGGIHNLLQSNQHASMEEDIAAQQDEATPRQEILIFNLCQPGQMP